MTLLVRFVFALVAFLAVGAAAASASADESPLVMPLIDFQTDDETGAWRAVNDGVMGGRSSGGPLIEDDALVFTGVINTRGGGFSSIRRTMAPGALTGGQALALTVQSDGRAYRVIARTGARYMGREVSYQAPIPASPPGTWSEVRVPLDGFTPTVFGQRVPAKPFDPGAVVELGFIIADGTDGPFELRVRAIGVEP